MAGRHRQHLLSRALVRQVGVGQALGAQQLVHQQVRRRAHAVGGDGERARVRAREGVQVVDRLDAAARVCQQAESDAAQLQDRADVQLQLAMSPAVTSTGSVAPPTGVALTGRDWAEALPEVSTAVIV